jgi:hypothetical protein
MVQEMWWYAMYSLFGKLCVLLWVEDQFCLSANDTSQIEQFRVTEIL